MKKEENNINISCPANAPVYIRVKCASVILEQYGDFLRAIIYINTEDKSMVDDIIQDFFISLVEHPIREGISDIKGYLYRAIINDVIDKARRVKDYQNKVQKYMRVVDNNIKQEVLHEDILLKKDEIAKLLKKITNILSQQEADAMLNYFTVEYDTKAGAAKTQVDTITFTRYVRTGLKKLRQRLKLLDSEGL